MMHYNMQIQVEDREIRLPITAINHGYDVVPDDKQQTCIKAYYMYDI